MVKSGLVRGDRDCLNDNMMMGKIMTDDLNFS